MILTLGFESPYQTADLARAALRVPAIEHHVEQPAPRELRLPQPRAPRRRSSRSSRSSASRFTSSTRDKIPYVIEEGERAAEKQLPYLRQLLGAAGRVSSGRGSDDRGRSGGRVLVVDDNEMNRDLLARRLQQLGHTSRSPRTGGRRSTMLAESEFDLVLLDIMMPELDGYQVLERMRADADAPSTSRSS